MLSFHLPVRRIAIGASRYRAQRTSLEVQNRIACSPLSVSGFTSYQNESNTVRCSSALPRSGMTTFEVTTYFGAHRLFSAATTEKAISSEPNNDTSKSIGGIESTDHTKKLPRRRRKSDELASGGNTTSNPEEASLFPPLTEDEYNPRYAVEQIKKASSWNQGRAAGEPNSNIPNRKYTERKWDYRFVRSSVDLYERHLLHLENHIQTISSKENTGNTTNSSVLFAGIHPSPEKCKDTDIVLAPSSLAAAVRALTRTRLDTPIISKRIRNIERLIGSIGWTPITEGLSYRLLEANGKAGNVRRTLALLELRRRRGYEPKEKEFIHVITSIQSSQLSLRRSRNIYLHETALSESSLDNPTRYLDAILVNMSQRGVTLTPDMAARMLSCYSSTGRTGRALHYFYKVVHDPIEEDGVYIPGPHPTHMGKEALEEWKNKKRGEGMGRLLIPRHENSNQSSNNDAKCSAYEELEAMKADDEEMILKTRVRMNMHPPPPFHKIPSAVKGASLAQSRNQEENIELAEKKFAKPMTKLEWELERDWSLSLTAAFAFADSLTHGACGHDPIELNITAWNALIKACCCRGAFHRALKILNETLPQKGVNPDSVSYNTILAGLARVGDISSLRELLIRMTNKNIQVNKYTVQAMADGLLNIGDISGASTMVQVSTSSPFTRDSALYLTSNGDFNATQDIFNQHDTLPPYNTHLKIIEFALANGLIFEAKRHVYFVQQLWKWQPSQHHSKSFRSVMEATKRNPKLNKSALQKLFEYYGEDLNENDFF